MKLFVHLQARQQATQALLAEAASGQAAVGPGPHGLVLEIAHPEVPRLVQLGDASGGLDISAQWQLSDAEWASLGHFVVVCRKTVPESDAAYRRNHAAWLNTPPLDAVGTQPIRLLRGLHLSKVTLRPQEVAGIGEWTASYLAGPGFWQAVREAGLSGLFAEPVLQTRSGRPLEGAQQLCTDVILPPVADDASVCGLLCYQPDQLGGRADFMHSAEPWANPRFGWPEWVVSARVRALFHPRGLQGWDFRPVLQTGSALHADYLTLCAQLRALVNEAANSRLQMRDW